MHVNYFEINARCHFDLGKLTGKLFQKKIQEQLTCLRQLKGWSLLIQKAEAYLKPTIECFPLLYEEIIGYSEGADLPIKELWTILIEDELLASSLEKCTLIVTNQGKIIGHNEDWQADAKDYLALVKKQIGELIIFELHYQGSLGGNSISINSHGYVQSINSLSHSDRQIGVPKNIIARFLSETKSPQEDCQKIATILRASGYHHAFISREGKTWSLECSAKRASFSETSSPFVHTNHYLSDLNDCDQANNEEGSFTRFDFVWKNIKNNMSAKEVKLLLENQSNGHRLSVFNRRTIGQMMIDFSSSNVDVWLAREKEKGWLRYPLNFLHP